MGGAIDAQRKVLYVADTFNNVVRAIDLSKIDPGKTDLSKIDLSKMAIATVAGTGTSGYASTDEGKPATQASLSYPTGLAVDQAGDLFIADTYNSRVREVVGGVRFKDGTVSSVGAIFTVAGTGRLGFSGENADARGADLYFPYGVALDAATPPNLYITDSFNNRIRRVDAVSTDSKAPDLIHTVAGDGAPAFADGTAAQAHFNRPWSATADQSNLYVADYLNHRIRRIDVSAQAVTTQGGIGTSGLKGDAGPADAAEVAAPRGVSMLGDSGAMLVADSFNSRIRWLGVTQAGIQRTQVNFDPTNLAGQSPPQSVTVTSTGSGLLVMGAVDLGADRNNFYLDPVKNTCAQARLEPGISCSFEVAFQPRAPGGHTGSVVIPNDAIGGAQVVTLRGDATAALVSNNCPSVMAAHSSCQITITLNQIGADDKKTRTGTLTVKDDAGGNSQQDPTGRSTTQSVPLTGSLAQSAASFNRQSLTFTQNIGTGSGSETVMLVNSGQAPLHLSAVRDDGDFSQSNNCPLVLAPGASCAISVTFVPSTLGERDGYIVVADDSVDSPQRIPVTGVATMALAQLGPDRLNFSQNVGAGTAPQTVTLTNRGDGPLSIGGIAATGDFKATSHCPSKLLPGLSCPIGVTFTPQAAGARSGSLVVTSDGNAAPGSHNTVRLTGFGYQPVASLSAATLSPGANLGGSAAPQVVTVTNTGDGALTIGAVGISGAAAGDYTQSNSCLRTIAPGGSCSITVKFTPHGYGIRAAALTLTDDGLGRMQSIALRGTGTAARPLLSSGYLNFGGTGVGNPTAPQSVVVFNAGNGLLSIDSISLTGDDFIMSTSCGSTLASGTSCMVSVTFLPQATGARAGLVTITDNAGTQRITLSGVGT
jgi:sugar lactone lactonase YvrE